MQHQRSLYSGTVDAFKKVVQREGVGGLYKGFAFSSLGMISGQIYLTTYELVRGYMKGYRSEVKGLVAGGTATLVAQSLTVPIDIVTQIMMMQGQAGGIRALKNKRNYVLVKNVDYIIPHREVVKLRGAVTIVRDILQREGVRGLYRGYHVSLLTYAPNSALWWAFYAGFYRKSMEYGWLSSGQVPIPLVQASCGVLSGLLAATLTNPLDVFRTRYQVMHTHTHKHTHTTMMISINIDVVGVSHTKENLYQSLERRRNLISEEGS